MDIQAQIEQIDNEIRTENQRGALQDSAKIAALEQKKQDLLDQQQAAQVEEKVAEAQTQVAQSFESITVGDQTVTLGALALNEPARQILQIYITQYVTGITEQNEKDKAALKASYETQISDAKTATDNLQKQYDALYETSNEQRKQILQLQAENEDVTARRDAAAKELDDAKQEITRLNGQVDDLRTEIAVGAKAAVKLTNVNGNLGDMIKQYNASKPAIYDLQSADTLGKKYTAKLAETGEPIEFGFLEKGKYREVSEQEAADIAARFQSEQAAAAAPAAEQAPADQASAEPAQTDGNADSSLVVPPIVMPDSQFQGSTDAGVGVAQAEPSVEVPGQATVEERIAALETRVAALEGQKVGSAA